MNGVAGWSGVVLWRRGRVVSLSEIAVGLGLARPWASLAGS